MSDAPGVLIIDDSLTVRMDLAEAFAGAGFRPFPCETAREAREALESARIDCIVLDVLLPDADGIELLRELRTSLATSVPVLLLSTEAEVKDRIRGLQTGADEFVGKPYDRSYVVARARELVASRRTPQAPTRGTLLVIDDSPTFREELQAALDAAGHEVQTAATGEEGLRLAAAIRPAAILVDGVLPGIDGATVIRRVRLDAVLRRTPCLLLTGSGGRGAEVRALDAGADAFVRKDEDMSVILARLATLLRGSAASTEDKAVSVLAPKRILAVDDSLTYLEEVADVLRQDGYDVVLARSGEEALELLSVQPVDCILLDLLMPGLSGQETCRRIKAAPVMRDIPLVLLTAVEEHTAMIEGLALGADDYISKSSEFEVLKARVSAQLRRRQFEDEARRMRAELFQRELEATEARAAREIAESRAALVAELEREIADRKVLEGELREKNRELEVQSLQLREATRLKSQFLANMSHELRTPLNAIIGFAELMHDGKVGPISPLQADCLVDVLTSSRHLLQLINDILDLSKIEAGRMEFRPESVDVAGLIREVTDTLRSLSTAKRIRIVVSVDPALGPVVIDPGRLKQVLYNYLSNAIKFTPEEGCVAGRAVADAPGYFRIEVEDEGPGISPEDVPRLFADFQQLDDGSAKTHQGTGLGLALTKRIVEAQGGRVGLETSPGQGSRFFAVLPRVNQRLSAPRAAVEPSLSVSKPR